MEFQPRAAVITAVMLMIICSAAEMIGVRLVESDEQCSGTPEVFYEEKWRRVYSGNFDYRSAMVVCRELDCGNAVNVTLKKDFRNWDKNEWSISIKCEGKEAAFSQCRQRNFYPKVNYSTVVICSESVKLVDGDGLCSGRLEVKTHQSWTTVCETDFDWQDAEVVCRELGCGTPLTVQGALFGEGKHSFGTREFQCKGTEEHLLTCSTSSRKEHTCKHGKAVGLTCTGPGDVRLVDRNSRCAGSVEMFYGGQWMKVGGEGWSMIEAAVVCRQLDCGSAIAAPWKENNGNDTTFGVLIECNRSQSALRECRTHYYQYTLFQAKVICSESVRLVDGAPSFRICSGRVEVKTQQSTWTTMCETDFDWQDGEVVCRELGCGTLLTLQGALYRVGKHPFGDKEFQCKGTEKSLLTCSASSRGEHTCTHGMAAGLTCSGPGDVRLVDGRSRCAGTVEIFHSGEWRKLGVDGWSFVEVDVVCRQLDCGSSIAAPWTKYAGDDSGRHVQIHCNGSESALRECKPYSYELTRFYAEVICSESVKLVDGDGLCSGRLEVKTHQSWSTVCETDFDWLDAEVVCRELGCGIPVTLQGALFGRGTHPFGKRMFECKATEKSLVTCSTSSREEHTCKHGNAVGLSCKGPRDVRLVDGGSRCAGTVEIFHSGDWRKVNEDYWSMNDVSVVCRQLNCGSALAAITRRSKKKHSGWNVGFFCRGSESELRKCISYNNELYKINAGVICSDLLEPPTTSFSTPIRVHRDLQVFGVFRGHSFSITCSIESTYPGGTFHLKLPWTNRSHTQTAVNHSAYFLFPAADDSHQGNYSCGYDTQVTFESELLENETIWTAWNFTQNFSSESEPLSITVTDSPLPAVIIRILLILFLLLVSCLLIFVIFKKCGHIFIGNSISGEAAVQFENIQLDSLQQNMQNAVERRSGEELPTDLEQEEEEEI